MENTQIKENSTLQIGGHVISRQQAIRDIKDFYEFQGRNVPPVDKWSDIDLETEYRSIYGSEIAVFERGGKAKSAWMKKVGLTEEEWLWREEMNRKMQKAGGEEYERLKKEYLSSPVSKKIQSRMVAGSDKIHVMQVHEYGSLGKWDYDKAKLVEKNRLQTTVLPDEQIAHWLEGKRVVPDPHRVDEKGNIIMKEGGGIRVTGFSGLGPEIIKAKKLRNEINIANEALQSEKKYFNKYAGNPAFGKKWEEHQKNQIELAQNRVDEALLAWKKEYGKDFEFAQGGKTEAIFIFDSSKDPKAEEKANKIAADYRKEEKINAKVVKDGSLVKVVVPSQWENGGSTETILERGYLEIHDPDHKNTFDNRIKETLAVFSYYDSQGNEYRKAFHFPPGIVNDKVIWEVAPEKMTHVQHSALRKKMLEDLGVKNFEGGGMIYIYQGKDYTPKELMAEAKSNTIQEALAKLGKPNVSIKGLGKQKSFQVVPFQDGGETYSSGKEIPESEKALLPKGIGKTFSYIDKWHDSIQHYYITDQKPQRDSTTNEPKPIGIWKYSKYPDGTTFDNYYSGHKNLEEATTYLDYLYNREVVGKDVKQPVKEYLGEKHNGLAESTAKLMIKKGQMDPDYNWEVVPFKVFGGGEKYYLKGTLKEKLSHGGTPGSFDYNVKPEIEIVDKAFKKHDKTQTGSAKLFFKYKGEPYTYTYKYGPSWGGTFISDYWDYPIYSTAQPESNTPLGTYLEYWITKLNLAKEDSSLAHGGTLQNQKAIDMLWALKNDGPIEFNDPDNLQVAEELVKQGLAEKTSSGYAVTRTGEKQLMENGGNISSSAIKEGQKVELEHSSTIEAIKNNPDIPTEEAAKLIAIDHLKESPDYYDKLKVMESTFENKKSSCNCPTMQYHKKLSDSQKEKLGIKYLAEGSTITDKKTGVVSDIVAVQHNGFELMPQSSFEGFPRQKFMVPFEELVEKHGSNALQVGGYENTEPDNRVLLLVVKDIMSGYIITDKENELSNSNIKSSEQAAKIQQLESALEELSNNYTSQVEEEVEAQPLAKGGYTGQIKASKAGVITEVRDRKGKLLKEVKSGGKVYKRSPEHRNYKTDNNEVLFKQEGGSLTTDFETGATSPKVDNLVLFADTTRNLAEMRDAIYSTIENRLLRGAEYVINELTKRFNTFLIKTASQYIRELGNTADAREEASLNEAEQNEFKNIYVDRFPQWLKEKYRGEVPGELERKVKNIFGAKYEKGGPVKVDYDRIKAINYWKKLKLKQRLHLLLDHADYVFGKAYGQLSDKERKEYKKFASAHWTALPKDIQMAVEEHVLMGTYQEGGEVELEGYKSENEEENNGFIAEDMDKAVKGILVLIDCVEDENEKEKLRQELQQYDYTAN